MVGPFSEASVSTRRSAVPNLILMACQGSLGTRLLFGDALNSHQTLLSGIALFECFLSNQSALSIEPQIGSRVACQAEMIADDFAPLHGEGIRADLLESNRPHDSSIWLNNGKI